MKQKYVYVSLIFCFLLAACFSGCAPSPVVPEAPQQQAETAQPDTSPQPEALPAQRTVTDMAGRSVTIPGEVKSGLGNSANGSYLLYTMDPGTMVGQNYAYNDQEKAYILPQYQDLPVFGQGGNFNLEAVIAAAPDVLIICGKLSGAAIADAEELQQQSGIPCIMLGQDLAQIPEAYRLLGQVFGQEQRCEDLALYAEQALAFAAAINIPEERRVRVYYGNGLENLETAPQGSPHAELLTLVQATNVAIMAGEITTRIEVSAEQVLEWDPQVVLLNGEPSKDVSPSDAVQAFLADSRYRNVQAVQEGQVYAIPKYPFSWFDRPLGPNRLIGVYWLAGLLYPEDFQLDIKAKARDYYSLFYQLELSEAQLTDLLGY